jgi:hypothetical protein
MPISKTTDLHTEDYWKEHFENFLAPLIKEVDPNLKVSRSQALREDILNAIIRDLIFADIVVADLTDGNSNVFWELGVRQSFTHGTITIAEAGPRVPFDLGVKGTLRYYPNDHLKNEDFRTQMKEAIRDCLEHPERADSHVLETITGRGSVFEIVHREEITRRLDGLLREIDVNKHMLKKIVETFEDNEKKDQKDWGYPTTRFILSSVELLLTERYLDAGQAFYDLADAYHRRATNLNEEMNLWPINPQPIQTWMADTLRPKKKDRSPISELIAAFEKDTRQARTRLMERM